MTWRLWPLLPVRSIPRYLEHMERDHGLRFVGLGWLPFFAKYKRIHPLHASTYDIDYFPEKDPAEIQEYFDLCEASGWEPVLQQNYYKIFREQPQGAIPLYWDEDERRAVWKKAQWKNLLATLFALILVAVLVLLVVYNATANGREGLLAIIYFMPKYMQLLLFVIAGTLLYAVIDLFREGIGVAFPWHRDPPSVFYGLGILQHIFIHLSFLLIMYCLAMTVFTEHFDLGGSLFGVIIGTSLGHFMRDFGRDETARRKLKGIYGPPKPVAIAAAAALLLFGVGLFSFQAYTMYRPSKNDEIQWVYSENIACETIAYEAYNAKYDQAVFELRDTDWIQSDLEHHRHNLMSVIAGEDIFHYMTPEVMKDGIVGGGIDMNARRAHWVAIELLLKDPEIDDVLISHTGHRYIVACDDRIYRLHSITFYDNPTLGVDTIDAPEIEAKGQEVYRDLMEQKEELEKMFLN